MVQPERHLERLDRPDRDHDRDRQPAAEELEESFPGRPLEEDLGHGVVGAVVDLAFEAIGLVLDVVHRRVDRDPGEEARRIADAVAGAVEAFSHSRYRPHELEDVDVIDIVHAGVVAEL